MFWARRFGLGLANAWGGVLRLITLVIQVISGGLESCEACGVPDSQCQRS